jgi:hypothetical protein
VALLIVMWVVGLAAATVVGAAVVARVAAELDALERWVIAAWIGLLAIAVGLLGVSLLMPVRPGVALVGLLVALDRRTRAELRAYAAALTARRAGVAVAILAVCASAAAQEVTWYDTGLYHYQAARWLADEGTVPGLALLHGRLGLVSSWFALGAAVDGFAPARLCGFGNGLALALWTIQLALAAGRRERRVADGFAIAFWVIYAPRLLASDQVASLSPDLAVTVAVGLTAWLVLLAPGRRLAAVVLAALAIPLKLTALPLLAVALARCLRRPRELGAGAAIGVVAILPLAAAGAVASGCLAYPTGFTCLDVPWGVGAEAASAMAALVESWYRWGGPTPPPGGWFVPWLLADRERALLLAVAAASAIALVRERREPVLSVAAMAALGVALMLALAPSARFALGSLIALPALVLAPYPAAAAALAAALQLASDRWALGGAYLAGVIAITLLRRGRRAILALVLLDAAALHARAYQRGRFGLHPLVPPSLATPATEVGARGIRVPRAGDRCGAAPLPCAPEAPRLELAPRGFRRPSP